MHMIFNEKIAHKLRAYLARNIPEIGSIKDQRVSVAVVNAADTCALTCPNCLFSAALVKKVFRGSPPFLQMKQMEQFVELMNEGGLELLVFSGGGESYENLDAMCYAAEHLIHIREVVTITSGYFATSPEATACVLDRFTNAMRQGNKLRSGELDFTLRISFDTFHNVPIEQIVNLMEYSKNEAGAGVRIRPIIRTILDPHQNLDVKLAEKLEMRLLPEKDPNDPIKNLPIIDGFPTRWLVGKDCEVPVIYKPTYFLGFAKKHMHHDVPGTSWQDVKTAEEGGDGFFNLSLRGTHGEGHNFYETVLRGYAFWLSDLKGVMNFITPKNQKAKRLSVYLPADGRMIINASAPDSWKQVETVASWTAYWEEVSRDALQQVAVSKPTDILLEYAKEVEPEIDTVLDARNFVFQVSYSIMETPALRLYLMIRILQDRALQGTQFRDPVVSAFVNITRINLVKAYKMAHQIKNIFREENRFRVIDPIIGNQDSIWMENSIPSREEILGMIRLIEVSNS